MTTGTNTPETRSASRLRRFAHLGVLDQPRDLLDHAVGGDLVAGAHDESITDGELPDGDAALGAVGIEDGDVLRAELQQRLQRGAGAASPMNSAYSDQSHAARTPTEMSVSIVAMPCLRFAPAAPRAARGRPCPGRTRPGPSRWRS